MMTSLATLCPLCMHKNTLLNGVCQDCGYKMAKPARKPVVKDWKCQECGRTMSLKQAQKAVSTGCKCGGVDIDLK